MKKSTESVACPVCAAAAHYLDTLDGNRSCEDARGLFLPKADWQVEYFLCSVCHFCFAPAFQSWSQADFGQRIYNAGYAQVDPDHSEARPQTNTGLLQQAFGRTPTFRHLDYGGGNGSLSRRLAQAGWSSTSFDPFYGNQTAPHGEHEWGLVTAFEVFEHEPHPHRLIEAVKGHLARPGLLIFSTLLSGGNIVAGGKLSWWYAAPRNGHVSLFTSKSLAALASQHGLQFCSFNAGMHAFWNETPSWASHLLMPQNRLDTIPMQNVAHQSQLHPPAGAVSPEEGTLRARVQANPGDHAAWHALGLSALNAGNLPLAVQCVEAAVVGNDKVALYHRNMGEMYRRMGWPEKAALAGRLAVKLAPTDLDAHYNLGLAYTDEKDYGRAIQSYRKALKLNPRHGLSWNNLGSVLEQQGDKLAALGAYEKAIGINPLHAEAQNNAGVLFSEQGKLDEARDCFQVAIAARADFVEAHYNLSSLKTYTRDDPHLAMLEAVLQRQDTLSEHARIRYQFSLGKALDDLGDYDRAFAAYDAGNRLQHALLPMDESRADALLAWIISVFDAQFFAQRSDWAGTADARRTPIFIVGMPRSGTTLLEQILCSHASVHGAGELTDLNEAVCKATGTVTEKPFTEGMTLLSQADLKRLGQDYLQRVWKLSPCSAFITDKMPANFFYLGLIHLALPGAKIIHAMRDPMDSCFSCFSQLFNDTMEFAYDQGTLGRYYARYMTLMRHWHQVLPRGTILDMPYEDMVADTETQARRLLTFAGLPWDPNCLKFYENKRLVKTASMSQVRRPIYQSSVARWKHFARHLQPLHALVKCFRGGDDMPSFAGLPEMAALPTPVLQAANGQADALHMEGISHYRVGRFDVALACYERTLALQPNFPAALNSKGFVLQDLDRMEEALACFSRAVELAPEMAMARLNLGMAQLKLGHWEQGWDNYEARWTGSAEVGNGTLQRPACPLPQWNGQLDTAKLRLLVITEQGFGDTFQFSRYLAMACARFEKVGFVCSQPTLRLMEWAVGDRMVLFTRMPPDYEAWDLHCPLMSLPRAFGTRADSIPAASPYLQVPKHAALHWRERLELAAPGRFRVGIAWAGRQAHQYDARRSLRFEQIGPLLKDERVTWVSLQKWAPQDARPSIPTEVDWLDWTEELTDFADTAALISGLDLVISIDSSMVHLAGALGRPVWMMNRFDSEWRWLGRRADSPWYPRLRIFNQTAFGEWDGVIKAVCGVLEGLPVDRSVQRKVRLPPQVNANAIVDVPLPVPLPANQLTPEQAMQVASQYQSGGRLQEADQLLRQILQVQPHHAHALHLLGVVAYQAGNLAAALDLIAQAIAIDPNVALFHSNFAEMNRQRGRIEEAIHHGERAVALDASMASAQGNLGIAYYDAKDYDHAEVCQQAALALAPQMLQSINNLGSIARARKDLKTAAQWYRKALAINPDYLESLSNLGAVLVEDDCADEAVTPLERALALQPVYPEALCNLGLVRLKQDKADEACPLLQRALQIKPGYPEAMVGLARALHEQDQPRQAKALLQQAVSVAHDKADAWTQLGAVCMELAEPGAAQEAYQRALAIDPKRAEALTGLGNLRLEEGKIEESVALFHEALAADADNLGARFHLTQAQKVNPGDANLMALEALAVDVQSLNEEKRISLHYALGKSYDDLKAYDQAFPHFLEGARLKRSKLQYSVQDDAMRLQRIIQTVERGYLERLLGTGDRSDVPVFVLGMPRSGTTLTEQIIASHPDVFGAGELRDWMEVVQTQIQVPTNGFQAFPENLTGLTPDIAAQWGADYVARLRRRAPQARRITDKMPANYLALGLIPLLLPGAKIIHVRRNPVDTCLSCFTRLFNRHQDATYDLAELGQHYANYGRLMQHWRTVLPPGSFMEVQYEDIVADMPTQARRLIDWCGLEWSDACLDFHKTQRNVRTASVSQVRQPIYASSVERWRHYESFLDPLLAGLGEFAPTL